MRPLFKNDSIRPITAPLQRYVCTTPFLSHYILCRQVIIRTSPSKSETLDSKAARLDVEAEETLTLRECSSTVCQQFANSLQTSLGRNYSQFHLIMILRFFFSIIQQMYKGKTLTTMLKKVMLRQLQCVKFPDSVNMTPLKTHCYMRRLFWSIITDYARAACGLQYKMDYTKIKETNITMSSFITPCHFLIGSHVTS